MNFGAVNVLIRAAVGVSFQTMTRGSLCVKRTEPRDWLPEVDTRHEWPLVLPVFFVFLGARTGLYQSFCIIIAGLAAIWFLPSFLVT